MGDDSTSAEPRPLSSSNSLRNSTLKLTELRSDSDSGITEMSVQSEPPDFGASALYIYDGGVPVSSGRTETTITPESTKWKSKAELLQETREKERKITSIFIRMKNAQKVYLCFLVDCTGSMSSWINEVKSNIKIWSKRLKDEYKESELHIAFVRYTDYDQPEDTRTTSVDFTEDLDKFYHFVDGITTPAGVGGDTAEDIFGGLHKALKLTWPKEGTKVLVHIADAPCHGEQYHKSGISDNYPGGDPSGLQLDNLMRLAAAQQIAYYFGYVNRSATVDMIKAFNLSLKKESSRTMSIREFDVSKAEDVLEAVYMSVSSSISTNICSFIQSQSGGTLYLREFEIEKGCPNWSSIETKEAEVKEPPPQGSGIEAIKTRKHVPLKIAPQPFGEGSQRIAYHGYDPSNRKRLVFKQFKWTAKQLTSSKRFYETVQVYAVASNIASEFNKQSPCGTVEIKFNPVGFVKFNDGGKKNYFTYEPFLEGEYLKYNNNKRHVRQEESKFNDACQAFSHFSWAKSKDVGGLVCDLQGVVSTDGSSIVLTDPAIHNSNVLLYGSTNLGQKGIDDFFIAHGCNSICHAMKLKRPSA